MITNSSLPIYHLSGLEPANNFEVCTRYTFDKV